MRSCASFNRAGDCGRAHFESRLDLRSPRRMKWGLYRGQFRDVISITGVSKPVESLTREREEPRIVAASTPSRIFPDALLRAAPGGPMDVVNSRCAGLDVHQATVVATCGCPRSAVAAGS